MKVRTRFAPSPTGNLHLGSVRTALYSWLYARHTGGEFILRIEDTDQERSTQASTQIILDSMEWLGLNYDQGPFYQAQRLELYRQTAERLINEGRAYRCYCSKERITSLRETQLANKEKPRYDGCCRDKNLPPRTEPYVVRFKNPQEGEVCFTDQVLGSLSFSNQELDDLVIIRSDGFPTYNFCVVIDDMEMGVTHVIRGADHVNNTPRQINILSAMGAAIPTYSHVPLILGNNGRLLSKRDGASSILNYREEGFLKEALLNYLIRLGWSHGNQEIFSVAEMVQFFDVKDINKAAAAFDAEKLLWLNRHYLKSLDPASIAQELQPHLTKIGIATDQGPSLTEVILALRERADTLVEMAHKAKYFYQEFTDYTEESNKYLTPESAQYVLCFRQALANLDTWSQEAVHAIIAETASTYAVGLGKIAQPVRVAVTGGTISPPLDLTLYLIGKERALARLDKFCQKIVQG